MLPSAQGTFLPRPRRAWPGREIDLHGLSHPPVADTKGTVDDKHHHRRTDPQVLVDGEWRESKTDTWIDITDSSTGEVIAQHAACAPKPRSPRPSSPPTRPSTPGPRMPVQKRTEVLFTWNVAAQRAHGRDRHPVSTELGKNLDEARGEVVKIIEAIDVAVGAPMLMKGESLMNVATGSRHGQLPRAARRVRRHRAVQLPGHDPLRLDAADLHRHRQHLRAQGRQPRAAHQPSCCSTCSTRPACPRASSTW